MKLQNEKEVQKILNSFGGMTKVYEQGKNKQSFVLYKFEPVYEAVKNTISSFFGISDDDGLFDDAFAQATTGDGNELLRIATLHSSALLPLLTFYKVSDKQPLKINGVTYNKVFFEVKNRVFNRPSNVDVVLYSATDKCLLFLESKFTEPLDTNMPDVSIAYQNWLIKAGLRNNGDGKYCKDGFDRVYYYGIKQMISHLIGLLKGPVKDKRSEGIGREDYEGLYKNKENSLILGSIIYDGGGYLFEKEEKILIDKYKQLYKECMTKLNDLSSDDCKTFNVPDKELNRVKICPEVLTYQDVFSTKGEYDFLDEKVRKFYFGEE